MVATLQMENRETEQLPGHCREISSVPGLARGAPFTQLFSKFVRGTCDSARARCICLVRLLLVPRGQHLRAHRDLLGKFTPTSLPRDTPGLGGKRCQAASQV